MANQSIMDILMDQKQKKYTIERINKMQREIWISVIFKVIHAILDS